MKYFNSVAYIKEPLIATVGTFDGLHLGHQALIYRVKTLAQQQDAKSAVISFWPPPKQVLQTSQNSLLLSTFEEKKQLISHLEVDYFFSLPFTPIFSSYSKEYFLENILLKGIGVNGLVVGENHRFGQNGTGSIEDLRNKARTTHQFSVEVFPTLHSISSTLIRTLLQSSHIEEANQYLGYAYTFKGKVVRGAQIGSKIGFPTANLSPPTSYKQLPGEGIYAAEVYWKEKWRKSMLYIGKKTVREHEVFTIEAHVFNLKEQNLYGHTLCVRCLKYLRAAQKITSITQLTHQLKKDKIAALSFFKERESE